MEDIRSLRYKMINQNMRLRLSYKQTLVLAYDACGLTKKEVAALMDITVRTVQFHEYCARERLQASNNAQAVYKACVLGILPIDRHITVENAPYIARECSSFFYYQRGKKGGLGGLPPMWDSRP